MVVVPVGLGGGGVGDTDVVNSTTSATQTYYTFYDFGGGDIIG